MGKDKVLICGGGTAGWLAALMMHDKFDVTLIESESIPPIGVGESTTETVTDVMRTAGIDMKDFVSKTNATGKYGVQFTGWPDYFHPFGETWLQEHIDEGKLESMYSAGHNISNLSPYTHLAQDGTEPPLDFKDSFFHDVALHWQNDLVAPYLKEFLGNKIKHHYHDIKTVKTDKNGVKSVDSFTADYYIDCTGSARLLSKQFGIEYIPFDDIHLDSAVVYSKPKIDCYYTESIKRKFGWEWSIPLQDRNNRGYVYCSKWATEQEILDEIGIKEDYRIVRFSAGVLTNIAYKNVISNGLSAHFIEPLEATNIEFGIFTIRWFMEAIESGYNYRALNDKLLATVTEIRDFIIFHYHNDDRFRTIDNAEDRTTIEPWHPFNWYCVAQGVSPTKHINNDIDALLDYAIIEGKMHERMASKTRDLP